MDRPSLGASSNSLKIEKLQNYNGEIVILFVDEKNVLSLALYFYYLFDTNATYVLNWAFLNTLELEIRESQELVKDFRRTARG